MPPYTEAEVGPEARQNVRGLLSVLGVLLSFAALTIPLLILRAAFRPRETDVGDLSDHHLADIGLTRGDVEPPRRPDHWRP